MNRNIDVADVIALYFPLLRKTLLMDMRTNDVDGPMIRVVPMANTPEERFQSLLKMRPRFGRPDSITIIPWLKYVPSLVDLGIWDHIVRRSDNMPGAMRVAAGPVVLETRAPGYQTDRREVTVAAGETVRVVVQLAPVGGHIYLW